MFLPAICFAQVELAGCKQYEPAIVILRGTLVRQTFPGPPNYSDVRKGDVSETYWFLNLPSPICVDADKASPEVNVAKSKVRRVQLVLDERSYQQLGTLIGKRVTVRGTLFGATSGHHHTPVLLTVASLDLAREK